MPGQPTPDLPPVSCCVKCHFRWEERHVLPYLPPALQQAVLAEHEAIRRCGFPKTLVDDHAERELLHFRAYCPAKLVAMVEADHHHLDNGGGSCGCGKRS